MGGIKRVSTQVWSQEIDYNPAKLFNKVRASLLSNVIWIWVHKMCVLFSSSGMTSNICCRWRICGRKGDHLWQWSGTMSMILVRVSLNEFVWSLFLEMHQLRWLRILNIFLWSPQSLVVCYASSLHTRDFISFFLFIVEKD